MPDAGKRKVADLLGEYSTNVGNALAEAVEEEKNSGDAEKKTLKRRVTLGRSEFQKMAKTLEAASDNEYVSAGSNRVRGDEAKALGDYKEAIEHFTKWKDALLKISGGKTTVEVAESLAVLGRYVPEARHVPGVDGIFRESVGGSIEGAGRGARNGGGYLLEIGMDV